ncbi:uncharacterized protein LOC141638263 [Silene latifolia]|uniref:uncharacterized protein LOC141638263 n=1 Tax=Silene latifolia TaxID=37657 RepID=UPI003D780DFF
MDCIKYGKPGAFFIDGPGGTGKTFLYGALYAKVQSIGKIFLPNTSSGIAASNLPCSGTTHSRFKIPLDTDEALTCDVSKQSDLACLLREATMIIWDEASMAKKQHIEVVDMLFKDVCSNDEPFVGKVIVFGGDFWQVLPVLLRRTQQEAVDARIVSSAIWPLLAKFSLTENIRARAGPEFSEFLLKLEIQEQTFSTDIFTERAILTPRNNDVDSINRMLIDKFPGQIHIYKNFDNVIDDNSNLYPAEFLNSLCPLGMTPHELAMKENSPVLLLRNLDPTTGERTTKDNPQAL